MAGYKMIAGPDNLIVGDDVYHAGDTVPLSEAQALQIRDTSGAVFEGLPLPNSGAEGESAALEQAPPGTPGRPADKTTSDKTTSGHGGSSDS